MDELEKAVRALRAKGATDDQIRKFVAEHASASASPSATAPAAPTDSVPASAAKRPAWYNAAGQVDDALTFGLGKRINAGFNAAVDAVRGKDSFSHSYEKNLEAEQAGLDEFANRHPKTAGALSGAGLGAQLVVAAPKLAAEGASEAALSLAGRMRAGAKAGGAFGAANALGHADPRQGVADNAMRMLVGGGAGAAAGAAGVPIAEGATALVRRAPGVASRALNAIGAGDAPAAANVSAKAAGIAGADAAAVSTTPADPASRILIQRLQRAGLTPRDALARVDALPDDLPLSVMELAGDKSHPVRQLGKLVARTPSAGAADLRAAIAGRNDPTANARAVLNDVADALEVPRTNLLEHADAMNARRAALAAPHYTAADEAPDVPLDRRVTADGPTLADLLKRPSMKSAAKFHNEVAAERGEPLLSLPGEEGGPVPPGFTAEQWAEAQEAMKQRGVAIPTRFGGASQIRDASGRLRSDLGKVSFDDLETELNRLKEISAAEEAHHAGVQESGYRTDYEELPRTERLGHKGKEDLPDADGNIDPEVLAGHNKIVKDYNRSLIVRDARQKAMDRIQAEMDSRPWDDGLHDDATSFNFGANASEGNGVPLRSLQLLKFKLDDMLEFAKDRGRFPDGTAATNAKLGAINDTRKALLEIMNAHSPDFAQGNEVWAGQSALQDAAKQGQRFLEPKAFGELQSEFPKLSAGEREQYKVGALNGPLRDRIYNTNATERSKLFTNPDVQERLSVIADPAKLHELNRRTDLRHAMTLTDRAVMGGSDTAENLLNQADANSAAERAMKVLVSAGPTKAAAKAAQALAESRVAARLRGINERTADALSPMLTAGMQSRPDLRRAMELLIDHYDLLQRLSQGAAPIGAFSGGTTARALGRSEF